jgi:hypothetical protein
VRHGAEIIFLTINNPLAEDYGLLVGSERYLALELPVVTVYPPKNNAMRVSHIILVGK